MTPKKKGTLGYYKELAKKVGYPNDIEGFNIGSFIKWAQENGILTNPTDINREKRKKVIKIPDVRLLENIGINVLKP